MLKRGLKMRLFKYTLLDIIVICSIVCGCSEELMTKDGTLHGKYIDFCNGDIMGVCIVDYNGNTPYYNR